MKYDVRKLLLDTLRIVPYTPGDTAGISDSLLAKAVTADENLHSLGYMLAPQDIVRLAVSPSLDSLFKEVQKTVPEMKASPMYPDFPGQVMKMSEAEFRFHQVLHYFSTYDLEWITGIPVSKGWLPDVKSTPKTEKDEVLLPYRVIELIPEDEVYGTAAKRILSRCERMTIPEQELILQCLPYVQKDALRQIPVAFKENLELIFPRILEGFSREDAVASLSGLCAHTGDVLKNSAMYLAKNRYRISTAKKRTLVRVLESYSPADFRGNLMLSLRRREKNLTVLAHLDYNRFAKSAPHKEAVKALREGTLVSWEGQAQKLVQERADNAIEFLAARPGIFIRRINALLNAGYSEEDITEAVVQKAGGFSTRTLITLYNSFMKENEQRIFNDRAEELETLDRKYNARLWQYDNWKWRMEWEIEASEGTRNLKLCTVRQNCSEKIDRYSEKSLVKEYEREVEALKQPMIDAIGYFNAGNNQKRGKSAEELNRIREESATLLREKRHLQRLLNEAGERESVRIYASARIKAIEDRVLHLNKKAERISALLEKNSRAEEHVADVFHEAFYKSGLADEIQQSWQKYQHLIADSPEAIRKILEESAASEEQIMREHEEDVARIRKRYHNISAEADNIKQKLLTEKAKEKAVIIEKYDSRLKKLATVPSRMRIFTRALEEQLKAISTPIKGKKVFIDPECFDLENTVLEMNDKSKDGTYVPSGFAYKIPEEAKSIRFYVYWNDKGRVDVDLHASGVRKVSDPSDPERKTRTEEIHIGWNSDFRNSGLVYSGDITHSDAAEYIDIDMSTDVDYVFFNVDLFYGEGKWSLSEIDECFVGMMAVKDLNERVELYSPANSFFTHNIYQNTRQLYYGYADIKNRFVRFVGKPDANYGHYIMRTAVDESGNYLSLRTYLDILCRSQNVVLTDCREEAETVLTVTKSAESGSICLLDENFFLDA